MLRLLPLCGLLSLSFSPGLHSQPLMVGDISIDPKDFAAHQAPAMRIAKCLACHGERAGGDIDFGPEVQFGTPALRGMGQSYLEQSLVDYKLGRRKHEEMSIIASMLDEEAIDFMARAFAAFPAPPLKTDAELETLADEDPHFRLGQVIAEQGIPGKGVPACTSCHGPSGEGNAHLGPRLAGQNSLYVQRQLEAYQSKKRQAGRAAMMLPVVSGLSSGEVEAVAYYYEKLIAPD